MDDADLAVRNSTYGLFVELGRAPASSEVAVALARNVPEVAEAWRRLHDDHALVLDATRTELRMANPFSAVPTPHRVRAADHRWFANCAWDAFGICAALRVDGRIESTCADCGAPLAVDVADEQPSDRSLLFHCLVPASRWWDDIVFT